MITAINSIVTVIMIITVLIFIFIVKIRRI